MGEDYHEAKARHVWLPSKIRVLTPLRKRDTLAFMA